MLRSFPFVLILVLSAAPSLADEQRMSPELLWKLGRLGEASLNSDASRVAYSVRHYNLGENSGTSSVRLLTLSTGDDRIVLERWASISSLQFAKSPAGERLFFAGSRQPADEPQAWALDLQTQLITKVTQVDGGLSNLKVSPAGTHIAFTTDVKIDSTVNELYPDLPLADARIIDSLMYRHWNSWHDFKYSHLHVAALADNTTAGEPRDLMQGLAADCPLPPFGGAEQFAWSPDGNQIAYTAKIVDNWAESTDSDVYLIDIQGDAAARNITKGMAGYDNNPVYSPDGNYLAFHSMERAGFEADRNRIMLYDRRSGEISDATAGLDQTAHDAMWLPDSQSLLFVSEYRGTDQIFQVSIEHSGAKQVSQGQYNWNLVSLMPDGKRALVSTMNMLRPSELAILQLDDAQSETITHINDEILAELALPKIEQRWVTATDGEKIHCWVIFPPDFDPSKKWPLLVYCQGGPQGQIGQWFSYRWNFHLMAANGYVVIAPNRRGLPGFGRQWNDQISGDWGGQAMQDILSATDSMLAEPYINKDCVAAIGASFGGYTVYWLMGNHGGRFTSMIAHCGVFNLESMYGSTEELFFVNWDLGGPYWRSRSIQEDYDRFSPHRFVANWDTPLLVIHGERDFRVPVTQGMEAFTAAQVQGVPSRFLYFPGEGHWVLGPQNGVLWHRVFFDWLKQHCGTKEE